MCIWGVFYALIICLVLFCFMVNNVILIFSDCIRVCPVRSVICFGVYTWRMLIESKHADIYLWHWFTDNTQSNNHYYKENEMCLAEELLNFIKARVTLADERKLYLFFWSCILLQQFSSFLLSFFHYTITLNANSKLN